jgi:hypothetical protein
MQSIEGVGIPRKYGEKDAKTVGMARLIRSSWKFELIEIVAKGIMGCHIAGLTAICKYDGIITDTPTPRPRDDLNSEMICLAECE